MLLQLQSKKIEGYFARDWETTRRKRDQKPLM